MHPDESIEILKNFRNDLYQIFSNRQDASMELVDSISSNTQAQSIVELSLNDWYRRNYCSITRALDEFYLLNDQKSKKEKNDQITRLLASYCPVPTKRHYYVLGVDVTPAPRRHAHTLEDRGFVHQPTIISDNKPITIGHEYSIMACLPDKPSDNAPPWIYPLSCQRVNTAEKATMVGMKQINYAISVDKKLSETLCVSVADSAYSGVFCVSEASRLENQIHISRLKNNRVLYRSIPKKKQKKSQRKKGALRFMGKDLDLKINAHGENPRKRSVLMG